MKHFALVVLLTCSAWGQSNDHPFGLLRPTPERYFNYPVTGIAPTGILPDQYSLETFFPPPGNQGLTQGSCTAWSTTFALRTALEAQRKTTWQPLSDTKRQFSPAFIFNRAKAAGAGPIDCKSGIFFNTALEILRSIGVPTLNSFPYDPNDCTLRPSQEVMAAAGLYRIASSYRMPDLSLLSLKTEIASGVPVLVGIDVYPSFASAIGPGTISGTGLVKGYHAIVLIGYDDEKRAFRLQNSWGPDWGEQGRAWMDYATLLGAVHEAYRVVLSAPPAFYNLSLVSRFGIVNANSGPVPYFIRNSMLALTEAMTPEDPAGRFAVLIASFDSEVAALNEARLISEGPTGLVAKVLRRTLQSMPSYSVLIAAGLNQDEAALVVERAHRTGFTNAAVLRTGIQ